MDQTRYSFLHELIAAPSPSGYEQPAQRIWRARVAPFADTIRTDSHGNVIASIHPEGTPRLMFAGHCDEIGFLVSHIDDDGFLGFVPVGGHDPIILPGQRVRVVTATKPIVGVMGRRPAHAMKPDDRGKGVELKDLWIDIGARDGAQARDLVALGDPVVFALDLETLQGNLVVGRALDNKVGAFVVAETLRNLAAQKDQVQAAVFGVSTVQEEIGLRGAQTSAYAIDAQVGIAFDVTHATDHPGLRDQRRGMGDLRVDGGPVLRRGANVNPVVFDLLTSTARDLDIPFQVKVEGGSTGTDGNAMQLSRGGMAVGILSVALRYMHTPVEIVSLRDVEQAVDLLTAFTLRLDASIDFTP